MKTRAFISFALSILLSLCMVLYAQAAPAVESDLNVSKTTPEGITLTALNIRTSDGAPSNQPDPGKEYVIVTFELTNGTGDTYFFWRDFNLLARQDGTDLEQVIPFTVELEIAAEEMYHQGPGSMRAGDITAGSTVTGEVGWVVDTGWQELQVNFMTEAFSDITAVFTFHPAEVELAAKR